MKIVHICLCGPMTDGWNYQENLLTKYQVKLGYEVTVITSKYCYDANGKLTSMQEGTYFFDGIKMIRINNRIGNIDSRFKLYVDFTTILNNESPDIIFVHGVQFLDSRQVVSYAKRHKVRIFVDNHADFSNSGTNWISLNLMHKIVWGHSAKMLAPYTEKFYGVLPARVDFLTEVYGIKRDKCDLLVMGADDDYVREAKHPDNIKQIRKKHGILDDDFLIITGGKIDSFKRQTLLLMEAVQKLELKNVKLIVFGSVENSLKPKVMELADGNKIQYIGWISANESYRYFASAQLAVFPGRHSVFWEQVAGQGIPMICKKWKGTQHIDLGGNVRFLEEDSAEAIYNLLNEVITKPEIYNQMLNVANCNAQRYFSYLDIAKRCVE